jgi:autotransporter-associated beta strand protein
MTNANSGAKTLVLGGAAVFDNTVTSVLANTTHTSLGVLSLQKIGASTWVLNPTANNTFTGSTTVSGGILKLQETGAGAGFDILPDAAGSAVAFAADTFTQAAGGTLIYLGASAQASTETLGTLTLTAGAGTITATPVGGGSATLTFAAGPTTTLGQGSNVNVSNTGTVNITGAAGFINAGLSFNDSNFAFANAGTTLRAPVYTDGLGGTGGDVGFKTTATALTTGLHNEITGSFSNGVLSVFSLRINGAQTLTLSGLLTIQTAANTRGGIIQTSGAGVITGTGVTSGGTGDLVIRVDSGSQLTLSAPITATTTGGWMKTGAGTLLVNASNAALTTTNAININEGIVKILSGNLGANNVNMNIRQGATLDLNGITTANNINALNGAGLITNTATGTLATITLGNNAGAGYFTGFLNDGVGDPTARLAVTKASTGTLSLTGLNTFTGPLRLTGGTIAATTLDNIGQPSGIGAGIATDDTTNAASIVFVSGTSGTISYTGSTATI